MQKKLFTKFNIHSWQKLSRKWVEGRYLSIIKAMYNKPTANTIPNGKKLKVFPLKSGMRQERPLSPLLFSIVFGVLAMSIKKKKK